MIKQSAHDKKIEKEIFRECHIELSGAFTIAIIIAIHLFHILF